MLYIIRHGKTDWNALYKLQGRTNIPLNEEGRDMAKNAAKEYKDINFDICFCSPLDRAKETAALLLEGRDIPIEYDDRLVEMGFGDFEGAVRIYEQKDHPLRTFFFEPDKYVATCGAESIEELFSRTGQFMKEKVYPLVEDGKDVLIVGHGAMNSSIICQHYKRPVSEFWKESIENCKLKTLI